MSWFRCFVLALSFLTRLPVKTGRIEPREMGSSVAAFGAVGAVVGSAVAGVDLLFRRVAGIHLQRAQLPNARWTGALLALVVNQLITGGLHLDGLADSADGLAAGGDRQRMLSVMKDSRIGAAGAAWLMIDLLSRFTLIATLPAARRAIWLLLAPVAGRLAQAMAIGSQPYARPEGTGKAFAENVCPIHIVSSVLTALAIILVTGTLTGVSLLPKTLSSFTVSVLAGVAFSGYISRRIGGLTGDTYGAINELAEISFLFIGVLIP